MTELRRRGGFIIPLVVVALALFAVYAAILSFSSRGEYRLVQRTIARERARYIARSALARASALILQNPFEGRWYRQSKGPYGYTGRLAGDFGGGSWEVRAEDVINELETAQREDRLLRITTLTYNRIDLFARGRFGEQSVILYQALLLAPEEKVYAYQEEDTGSSMRYTEIRIR